LTAFRPPIRQRRASHCLRSGIVQLVRERERTAYIIDGLFKVTKVLVRNAEKSKTFHLNLADARLP
jgi:hypothetical protein